MVGTVIAKVKGSSAGDDYTMPASDGASGTYLKTDGSGNLSFGAIATAGFVNMEVYTASGTWTKTDNDPTKIVVEVQGAGGGGARGNTAASTMGAGGGGYARKFLDVTNIDTVTVVVGAYGAASTGEPTGAGSAGGLSSFIKATGSGSFTDIVGNGGAAGTNAGYGAGVAGGTGTGGDMSIQGGRGQNGGDGQKGGGAFLGIAGKTNEYTGSPNSNALGYGGGGGGGYNQHSGDGAPGIVIVWEYK